MVRFATAATLAFSLVLAPAAMAAPGPTTTNPADLPAGDYKLDKDHASLTAKIAHMGGFSNFALRLPKIDASFSYDPKAPANARITATIDATQLDTGLPGLDKEITGDGWFDSAKYPTITFVSTSITDIQGNHGKVNGDLTFHGVTKPVTLDVTFNGYGNDIIPLRHKVGFSATGVINRTDFGVSKYAPVVVGETVNLTIEAEFLPK